MPAPAYELNLDGLIGMTHNYGGLSYGNLASMKSAATVSSPRRAALQGLEKMALLVGLGLKQAVLPPHERPHMGALRRLGYSGRDADIIERVARDDPALLVACAGASSMWAANAATISPASDAEDRSIHITPANLAGRFHRSLEADFTAYLINRIFPDPTHFTRHDPLPSAFHDEGAANHCRFCEAHGGPGVELFVYGRRALDRSDRRPAIYPARQTREASEAIARLHRLTPDAVVIERQNPDVIDEGVFHNDVISTANERVFLYHERAFEDTVGVVEKLSTAVAERCDCDLSTIRVTEAELSVEEAVSAYLFNSQIVTLPDGTMSLIAPTESLENVRAKRVIDAALEGPNPISSVHYTDLRQSMMNGGGPACLRLRLVLSDDALSSAHQGTLLNPQRCAELRSLIERRWRDRMPPADLADPDLLVESRTALDELTGLLGLGSIYPFQRGGA